MRAAKQFQLFNCHISKTEGGCMTVGKGGGWEERGCWEVIIWRGKITRCGSENNE